MADNYRADDDLAPLSELSDYEVADDSTDVRGWKVTGNTGEDIGKVDDLIVDRSTMQARYLVVALEGGDAGRSTVGMDPKHPVLVPVQRVRIHDGDKRVHFDSPGTALRSFERYQGKAIDRDYDERFGKAERPGKFDADTQRLTRSAEEVRIGKRKVSAGDVAVRKHVETEHVKQPVTRTREEVTVERRPVSGDRTGKAEIREDEVRIPVTEEEVIVEKRPVVKEELVVGKKQVQEQDTVETDVRRERIEVDRDRDRTGPGGSPEHDPTRGRKV